MTNDEYSQLAAKAAGVAIGSNGKPAFTSYEQSMKYAEALTNLHKSGINKNSTPQEIAAASVGTTVNKNGTPNISSVSQGQGYGSALKNITTNIPARGANNNQNTSSTKPASTSSTSTNKPTSSSNSTSAPSRLSNADYNRIAAQIVGVPTDEKGNPVCNSYEQYMQFGQTLSNLHNGGINANSTPQEIAAASVGTKLDKSGKPIISNVPQGQNYGKALKATLKIVEDVSSGAPAKSNGEKVNINNNSQSTDSTSLSMTLTGSHSESIENYLINLEKTYGTQYVFENVFKGDKNKYNPVERAEAICGFKQEDIRGNAMAYKYEKAYWGIVHKPNQINNINSSYFYDQNDYGGSSDCCRTALAMMVSINTGEGVNPLNITTSAVNGNIRNDLNASEYSSDKKGYNSYSSKNSNDIYNIIKSEIDAGRAVEIHTSYGQGSQHWVTVTGYTVNGNGEISFNCLSGIDPWGGVYTSDLSHSSVSSTSVQYLRNDPLPLYNGYTIRTYNT